MSGSQSFPSARIFATAMELVAWAVVAQMVRQGFYIPPAVVLDCGFVALLSVGEP
jgi:hypothetical protein